MASKKRMTDQQRALLINQLQDLSAAIRGLGQSANTLDIKKECRYPLRQNYTIDYFYELYVYNGVASRIIDFFPSETWKYVPYIFETENERRTTQTEKDIAALLADTKIKVLSNFAKADSLSRIGEYGAMLIGFDDVKTLSDLQKPVIQQNAKGEWVPIRDNLKIRSLTPLWQKQCLISSINNTPSSDRYGQPEMYYFDPDAQKSVLHTGTDSTSRESCMVHWSRMIHFSPDTLNNTYQSRPILARTIEEITNVDKIKGASGQGYWSMGFPAISIETLPELFAQGRIPEVNDDEVKEEFQKFQLGLQRYLGLSGQKANVLSGEISDPTPFLMIQLNLIALTLDVPLKMFLGAGTGPREGSEDRIRNSEKIAGVRKNIADTCLIPFFERCAQAGVIKAPNRQLQCTWLPAFDIGLDEDRANRNLKFAQAIAQYAGSNAPSVVGPISFLTSIGMTNEQAKLFYEEGQAEKKKIIVPTGVNKQTPGGGVKKGGVKDKSVPAGRPKV